MNIINFIAVNFIDLILIIGFIIGIILFRVEKDKKIFFVYAILALIFSVLIYDYDLSNNPNTKLQLNIMLIMIVGVFYFCAMVVAPLKTIHHIILLLPMIGIIIGYFLSKDFMILLLIVSIFYFIYTIIISIYNLKLPNQKEISLTTIAFSIICVIAVLIQFYNSELKNKLLTVILISTIVIYIIKFVKSYSSEKVAEEKKIQTQRTSIAISQIQPHFLYNSLATIGYICKKDQDMASMAIDKFSDYLRANLNSLKQENNIPFKEELKHVETYLWLEKLRFEDRLNIIYDIQVDNFLVPPLSIQPLVENAVKHGICEKIEGGTLYIRTVDYYEKIMIVIEDTGVGFDVKAKPNDNKTHVGMQNVKDRIKSMANGELVIRSTIGKGTVATITIPKDLK